MKILSISIVLLIALLCPISAHADDGMTMQINQKLDKVLNNQAKILSELDNVKKELEIVKVRATLGN